MSGTKRSTTHQLRNQGSPSLTWMVTVRDQGHTAELLRVGDFLRGIRDKFPTEFQFQGSVSSGKDVKAEEVSVTRAKMRQQLGGTLQHKPVVTGSPSCASPGGIKTPAHQGAASSPGFGLTPDLPSSPSRTVAHIRKPALSFHTGPTPCYSSPSREPLLPS